MGISPSEPFRSPRTRSPRETKLVQHTIRAKQVTLHRPSKGLVELLQVQNLSPWVLLKLQNVTHIQRVLSIEVMKNPEQHTLIFGISTKNFERTPCHTALGLPCRAMDVVRVWTLSHGVQPPQKVQVLIQAPPQLRKWIPSGAAGSFLRALQKSELPFASVLPTARVNSDGRIISNDFFSFVVFYGPSVLDIGCG